MEPAATAASPSALSVGQPFRMRLSPAEHRRLARGYQTRRALVALGFLLPNLIFFIVFPFVISPAPPGARRRPEARPAA